MIWKNYIKKAFVVITLFFLILFLMVQIGYTVFVIKDLYHYYQIIPHYQTSPVTEYLCRIPLGVMAQNRAADISELTNSGVNLDLIQTETDSKHILGTMSRKLNKSYYIINLADECYRIGDDFYPILYSCNENCCIFSVDLTLCSDEISPFNGYLDTSLEKRPAIAFDYQTKEIKMFDQLSIAQQLNICGSSGEIKKYSFSDAKLDRDPQRCKAICYSPCLMP